MAVGLTPVSDRGWRETYNDAVRPEDTRRVTTVTLSMPFTLHQEVTSRVLPEFDPASVHLDYTELHWQSTQNLLHFFKYLDAQINGETPELTDTTGTCEGGVCGSTCQPQDRAIMRPFKFALQSICCKQFASNLLNSMEEEKRAKESATENRTQLVEWVVAAARSVSSRSALTEQAWSFMSWKNKEDCEMEAEQLAGKCLLERQKHMATKTCS
eukprot:1298771-Amphidinium_carterae.1